MGVTCDLHVHHQTGLGLFLYSKSTWFATVHYQVKVKSHNSQGGPHSQGYLQQYVAGTHLYTRVERGPHSQGYLQQYVAGTHLYTWVEGGPHSQGYLQQYVAGTHLYTWVEGGPHSQGYLQQYVAGTHNTPGWRETVWGNVSCLRKQLNGRD